MRILRSGLTIFVLNYGVGVMFFHRSVRSFHIILAVFISAGVPVSSPAGILDDLKSGFENKIKKEMTKLQKNKDKKKKKKEKNQVKSQNTDDSKNTGKNEAEQKKLAKSGSFDLVTVVNAAFTLSTEEQLRNAGVSEAEIKQHLMAGNEPAHLDFDLPVEEFKRLRNLGVEVFPNRQVAYWKEGFSHGDTSRFVNSHNKTNVKLINVSYRDGKYYFEKAVVSDTSKATAIREKAKNLFDVEGIVDAADLYVLWNEDGRSHHKVCRRISWDPSLYSNIADERERGRVTGELNSRLVKHAGKYVIRLKNVDQNRLPNCFFDDLEVVRKLN